MSITKHREEAREDAEIRVSALLQAFAMPRISGDQIRELLIDAIANASVSGYATGWREACDRMIEVARDNREPP